MIHTLTMPKWGLSMTEGRIDVWLKQPGDRVEKGEEVLDVDRQNLQQRRGAIQWCIAPGIGAERRDLAGRRLAGDRRGRRGHGSRD